MLTYQKLLAACAVCVLSLPGVASADFTGPYAGAAAGYTSGTVEADYDFSPLGAGSFSGEEDVDGLEFGLFGGYRHQFDNRFVMGAEIGGMLGNVDGSRGEVLGGTLSLDKNNEFYVSLKPGYAVNDRALVYLIGGYQRANFELSWTDGTDSTSEDDTFNGFHFGAGAEFRPTPAVSFRAEYKNQRYGDKSYSTAGIGTESYDGDENTFRVGAAYNF